MATTEVQDEEDLSSENEDPETLPDPLLRFVETFNFKKYVLDVVVPSETEGAVDTVADGAGVEKSAHMLGQCKNGEILFSWDRRNADGDGVTVVAVFSPQSKTHRVVYEHDCEAHICNASVNAEKTLLAFTIKEAAYEEDQCIYDSFMAEIQPQGRVFTLNIPSPDFRTLQFLHVGPSSSSSSSSSSSKNRLSSKSALTSHLLVVIPGVLISLYHFKMQQIVLGAVMMDHPKQEIIQKNFTWYQWDPHTQWLYHARFEATPAKASMSGKHSLLLSCENFSLPQHPLVFTVSLPLPYSDHLYNTVRTHYDSPFAFTLPVREMNLQVLYRRDGYWCACLQHCTGTPLARANSDGISSEGNKIDYSVYVIHNGHVLYGQVPLSEVSSEALYIHFMLVGCFVAAYIPDVMLHLLNLGPQVDPCHHLTFGSNHASFAVVEAVSAFHDAPPSSAPSSATDAPTTTTTTTVETADPEDPQNGSFLEMAEPSLSMATSGSLAGDYDPAVLDCTSGVIYECSLNIAAFFSLFKSCEDFVLKEDLLHLMVIGFRHHGTALSMLEHVCQTPLSMCDHRLFAEFIISSSYANVYFDCKKFFARQLPLTTAHTYHGKVSKYQDGGNRALLKVMQIPNFVKQLLVQSDQTLVMATPEELLNYDPSHSQPFENLCFNAVLSQPEFRRIDIKKLPGLDDGSQQAGDSSSSSSSSSSHRTGGGAASGGSGSGGRVQRGRHQQHHQKTSHVSSSSTAGGILNRIATFGRKTGNYTSPMRSLGGHDPLDMLTFLGHDKDLDEQLLAEASGVREQLVSCLIKGLPLRTKNMAYNMVSTYVNELQKQCCTVLLVIWQSLGFSADNHPLNASLCRSTTTKEQILFELLEAYQLALLDLGLPLPMGFQTLFVSMGYLTQEKTLFLQYLRNGVFTPTKKFVELLLEDSEDEEADVVFQVFCNLDYGLAEFAIGHWQDPMVRSLEQPSKKTHGHNNM